MNAIHTHRFFARACAQTQRNVSAGGGLGGRRVRFPPTTQGGVKADLTGNLRQMQRYQSPLRGKRRPLRVQRREVTVNALLETGSRQPMGFSQGAQEGHL
jgi:hypothetical protein